MTLARLQSGYAQDARATAERYKLGATRYETARLLNPRQWKELWSRRMKGENFDAMIDEIAATSNYGWKYNDDI